MSGHVNSFNIFITRKYLKEYEIYSVYMNNEICKTNKILEKIKNTQA